MVKRKPKIKTENIEYTVSSGNVYADFEFQNPQEAQTKAELAMTITDIIKQRKLTQAEAAEIIGIDQPKISKITRGLLSEFTIERLMRFVLSLGFDIELKLKRHRTTTTMPSIHISCEKNTQRAARA